MGYESRKNAHLQCHIRRGKLYETQWSWQDVKLTRLMSIFTSSLEFFDENSADKFQYKKDKMDIMKNQWTTYYSKAFFCKSLHSFCNAMREENNPPVYLHLIFEIWSVTRFFFNFEISSLKNRKINLISKLIFAGYTGSKNQVRIQQKIEFVSKSIFFEFVINSQIDISKIKHR